MCFFTACEQFFCTKTAHELEESVDAVENNSLNGGLDALWRSPASSVESEKKEVARAFARFLRGEPERVGERIAA